MSNLYMELDTAVDRVILLSQQCGNLAEYGKNPEDKEWLRNELEQICHLPCDVGPLPKWNTGKPKEGGRYLVSCVGPGFDKPFVEIAEYYCGLDIWHTLYDWIRIIGWVPLPKAMKNKEVL